MPGTVQSMKEKRAKVDTVIIFFDSLGRQFENFEGKSWRDLFIYNGKWLETRDAGGLAQVRKAVPVFPVNKPLGQLTGYPVALVVFVSW